MYIPSSKSINSTSTKELLSILIKEFLKKLKLIKLIKIGFDLDHTILDYSDYINEYSIGKYGKKIKSKII